MPVLPALAAFLIALYGLERRQLWRDEIATWAASTKSMEALRGLVEVTDAVIAPYYLLMHGWIAVFGESEASLRMPSIIAVALAAALTAVVGRKLFDPMTGLFAGLLVAVLPTVSRYAQEARPYALATAAVALATLLVLRAAERPTWLRWLAYAVVVAVAGLLHMVALLLLPAHMVYVLSLRRKKVILRWFLAAVAAVIPVVPLAWIGSEQAKQVSWIPEATWDSTNNEIVRVTGSVSVSALIIGLAVLGAVTLGRRGALLGTWAVAPFYVLLLISPVAALLIHRYVLFTLPAWCLLAVATVTRNVQPAAGTATSSSWRRVVLPAMLVVLCAAFALPMHATNRGIVVPGEPDLRGAVAVLAAEASAGDAVGIHAGYASRLQDGVNYYLRRADGPGLNVVFTAWPGGVPTYGRTCRNGECLRSAERLWLVGAPTDADQRAGMNPSLKQQLAGFEQVRVVRLTGVTVSLWQTTERA
ncbi:glycosyltransferase family 39 protein [Micromonospora cremea]|uniref:glycosyltransferase family 39 protein n=1 Tax=Micromonospora cremea TaxID=709881 RepID=UPI0009412312|nr:glycosyltransferase family 39 protein [Micromonospora cremea]